MQEVLKKFKNSIFYPGGGTDLQVLLRLSDISDTVISPTLSDYLTIKKYDQSFREKCDHINSFYGHQIISYKGYTQIDSKIIQENDSFKFLPGFFTNTENHEYENYFDYWIKNTHYDVAQFHFERYIDDIMRPLSWIAMKTEGIATLNALANLTNESPQALCTIQTGTMELPNSFFVKLLRHLNLSTKIWIRGYWDFEKYENLYTSVLSFPPYHLPIKNFDKWYSPMGMSAVKNEENGAEIPFSRAKAFSNSKNLLLNIPEDLTLAHPTNSNRTITLKTADIIDYIKDYDSVITSKSIISENLPNVSTWESLSDHSRLKNSNYPAFTFVESIQKIKSDFCGRNIKRIAITPIGFEDEIIYLKSFLEENDTDLCLDIYGLSPFDILKIKIAQHLELFQTNEYQFEIKNNNSEDFTNKELSAANFNKIIHSNPFNNYIMCNRQENCPLYQKHHNVINGIYTLLRPKTWEEIPVIDKIDTEDETGEMLDMLNDLNVYFTEDFPELKKPSGSHGIQETIFIMIHKDKYYLVETQGEDFIKFATEITNMPWIKGLEKGLKHRR